MPRPPVEPPSNHASASGQVRAHRAGAADARLWIAPATASPVTATAIVHEIVARINDIPGGRRTTAWEVDHALRRAGRALPA
ncbi:hypothetical protein [Rhodococcus sp. KRD197]|uniref:hypothetical protein n=1 Tax=Rhodococcus sp. KRD197 TaxID=2729731 RepID=UPI0019D2E19F|nr:hypothetical protein [Rhodococcus sp. KRD197]